MVSNGITTQKLLKIKLNQFKVHFLAFVKKNSCRKSCLALRKKNTSGDFYN